MLRVSASRPSDDAPAFRAAVGEIQNAPRVACKLDRAERATILVGAVATVAGLSVLAAPAVGVAAIALPIIASAAGISLPFQARRVCHSLGHGEPARPRSLRKRGFHLAEIAGSYTESKALVHWLKRQHVVTRGRQREVTATPTVQELRDRGIDQAFGNMTEARLQALVDYLAVVHDVAPAHRTTPYSAGN